MGGEKTKKGAPSTADKPDLGWSQVRETVLMVGVAMGQFESAMKDGNESERRVCKRPFGLRTVWQHNQQHDHPGCISWGE